VEDVQRNLGRTGYDPSRLHFIKGKVEETLPGQAPDEPIALLRLDTDWYSSTKHELVHLFPRLVPGGVLILDDYGWWKGSRQAYDEYAKENGVRLLLNRIDNAGRLAIKTACSA
jgi:predicted O-methyltransferase YrrM